MPTKPNIHPQAANAYPVLSSVASSDLPLRKFSKARSLASRLGLHPKTIFRWADCGLIHRHKINSRVVLFDDAELAKLIEDVRVGSSSTTTPRIQKVGSHDLKGGVE